VANFAVLASGNGSNFQALAKAFEEGPHALCCLICDKVNALVIQRSKAMAIPAFVVNYGGRERRKAELEILEVLRAHNVDLVVLAGFMRLLSPLVVDEYAGRIVNIHPSLLPKYPGINAIAESYNSRDTRVGITVHWVDHGMDSGPVIIQRSLNRIPGESLAELERRIHELEHRTYPETVLKLLDQSENPKRAVGQVERRTQ